MKKRIKYQFIFVLIFVTGCTTYTITRDSLVEQLTTYQKIEPNTNFQKFALIDYPSNNLKKIKCEDKNGNKFWLFPDKNTEFIIIKKSTGEKVKAYFDTLILQNDSLYGLRSRLMGGIRIIPISDVDKIFIYSELPHTEKIIN